MFVRCFGLILECFYFLIFLVSGAYRFLVEGIFYVEKWCFGERGFGFGELELWLGDSGFCFSFMGMFSKGLWVCWFLIGCCFVLVFNCRFGAVNSLWFLCFFVLGSCGFGLGFSGKFGVFNFLGKRNDKRRFGYFYFY